MSNEHDMYEAAIRSTLPCFKCPNQLFIFKTMKIDGGDFLYLLAYHGIEHA